MFYFFNTFGRRTDHQIIPATLNLRRAYFRQGSTKYQLRGMAKYMAEPQAKGLTYDHRPRRLLPRLMHKHSFKHQLHSTQVGAVDWEPQNSSRHAYGDSIS